MSVTFKLAPMTLGLRVLTVTMFVLPALFLYSARYAPPPVNAVMAATTAFMALIYASIWFLFRPTRFELDAQALRIVWPLRTRVIERANIESARILTWAEFRKEYGYGMRIGAGWTAAQRMRAKGIANAQSHIEHLLADLPPHCTLVTVIDGHPATLAWLGGVQGHRTVPLGVEHFGQTGTIPDLYRHFGIDAYSIVARVNGLTAGRRTG